VSERDEFARAAQTGCLLVWAIAWTAFCIAAAYWVFWKLFWT